MPTHTTSLISAEERELLRKIGRIGGKISASRLTPERRAKMKEVLIGARQVRLDNLAKLREKVA